MQSFFTSFDVDYPDNSASINLNFCVAMKHHSIALWKTDLMNSIVADARSKTKVVKVVQKQSLCQRTVMPCVIW